MDSDEEDFVFYGTPIESEEATISRKKKAIAEASGQLRTLPPWKQEVRDEEGRRRFHGAFTGGFSAGFYNTVGSKEGWTPQSFTSSRKNRAEVQQQSIFSFLDEDERAELEGQTLGTNSQFDTFGFTAAEYARKQAEKDQHQRPSAIPGPVPDELVLPVADSIGIKLLLKMGWRRGHSLKDLHANSLYDTRREARKAFLAFSADDTEALPGNAEAVDGDGESSVGHSINDDVHSSQSTPVFVLNPKQDLHGLGYDPFKHAPEFREKKKLRMSASRQPGYGKASSLKDNLLGFNSGKVGPGFGIGALEELDAEDEDVYASGFNFEETYVEEVEEPSRLSSDNKQKLLVKDQSVLHGFRVASISDYQLQRFDPPVIPKDFVAYHKFPGPLETDNRLAPPPPEVPPPEDSNLKLLIEGVATLVARCGKLFEDLSREKNQSNPLFGFLNGGSGHEYYARKLWEEQQKHNDHTKQVFNDKNLSPSVQKMTADSRGKLLGERPLERTSRETSLSSVVHFQSNLSETFTKPASIIESSEIAKPFKDDPAKQERFVQYLKQKYEGGLRSTDSGGANYMSEAARARERLDFEAAAEAIEKGKLHKEGKHSTEQSLEFSAIGGMHFTSGGLEKTGDTQSEHLMLKKMCPKREEFQWRPSPLLCKRFDLVDPFMGKPPPAPRIRSKMDSLIFMPDSFKATGFEETGSSNKNSFPVTQPAVQEMKDVAEKEDEAEVEVENVDRPVDLYKAIFSDDSEDEVETSNTNNVGNREDKNEAAATTLNRLIASDFLESLGKELGLEVPPDAHYSAGEPVTQNKVPKNDAGNIKIQPIETKSTSAALTGHPTSHWVTDHQEIAREDESKKIGLGCGNPGSISGKYGEAGSSENGYGKIGREEIAKAGSKDKSPSIHHRQRSYSSSSEDERSRRKKYKSPSRHQKSWSSSESSEDERTRKRSRRRQHRIDSYSESSGDHRDRYSSRSKGRKKGSSREKSSSKKHSKHHKHGNRSSHYSTDKEHGESRREKQKSRD